MKSRVFVLIKLMEELGLPVSRLMGQSSNVLPITKPVLTKPTIDLSSVNTKSLAKESTDTLNLLRNNKLSGQEIEQTIRNLQDIKATTQAKPSATVIELSTKETIPTEGVMNLAKQQEMSKSIPGKAKQLQGRVENIEKDFTDFTKALDARGEIPGASRQEAIEIAKAKMKGMGYAAEEIEDIAKDPKRIQIATDIIIPDEGFQMGGRVEMAGGGITALKTLIRFLGKDSGKKGSQMLKEINPKQFGYKFDMLDPEMKKQINDNRLEYIEQLSDSIKSDRKLLREIKDMPKEWQDFMYKQANEGGNKGRLDVYNKIDIDDAIGEIEQLKKNLEFKNIPAKEVKRKMNSEGGRIEMAGGGLTRYVLKLLGKKGKDLTGQTKQFREGPITSKFLEEVDSEVLDPFIRTRDTSGRGGYGLYKDFEEMPAGLKAAEFISRIKTKNGEIDYGKAEAFIGTKLKGTESIDELIETVSTPQRIKKAVGGSVYDQYQDYLNQVNSQSSDPLYSNILYNQPSMNDTGSGDDDIDVTKDQTVGSSKALDYYNNQLGYVGRTGVNSLLGMINPMLGAVGQMYNQGKSLYDLGSSMFGGVDVPKGGSFSKNPGIGFSNRDPEDTQDYGGGVDASNAAEAEASQGGYDSRDSGDYE